MADSKKPTHSSHHTHSPASPKSARSDISVAGEKAVNSTDQSVDVDPVDESPEAEQPIPPVALDRRENVEPGGPVGRPS